MKRHGYWEYERFSAYDGTLRFDIVLNYFAVAATVPWRSCLVGWHAKSDEEASAFYLHVLFLVLILEWPQEDKA